MNGQQATLQNDSAHRQASLAWIDIAKALAIILVLLFHVRLKNPASGENYLFIDWICHFVGYVNMPTFVFVSGFLLYRTRIGRDIGILQTWRDKLVRLAVPLVFCTVVGNLAQMVFNSFVKHPHDVSLTSFCQSFIMADNMPWPHRWYLIALMVMMALYPLYKQSVRHTAGETAVLIFLVILQYFPIYVEGNWLCLREVQDYLVYFYLGIMAAEHGWWKLLKRDWLALGLPILSLAIYVLFPTFVEHCHGLFSIICVCAVLSIAMLLERVRPQAFSSFRGYVFTIYLFGIAFQAFVELILWPLSGCPQKLVVVFYALNVFCGLYLPVLIGKIVEKIPSPLLRQCFGLK